MSIHLKKIPQFYPKCPYNDCANVSMSSKRCSPLCIQNGRAGHHIPLSYVAILRKRIAPTTEARSWGACQMHPGTFLLQFCSWYRNYSPTV